MRVFRRALVPNVRSFAILSLLLGAASLCGAASITYDVDLTIGAASVTGFIETDGTTGPYYEGAGIHILDWNLLLTEGALSFDLLGPLSGSNSNVAIEDMYGHGMFSATATELLYDFGTGYGGVYFNGPANGVADTGFPSVPT